MIHLFIKGIKEETLVLFHGTGGNEYDLISLAKKINPEANILSLRGNIDEHGYKRFFKRIKFGVFDEESLTEEAIHIKKFIDEASEKYQFSKDSLTAVGYSNGANMIAGMLYHYPNLYRKAMLLHAMRPYQKQLPKESIQTDIFISAGRDDSMVPIEESTLLKTILSNHSKSVYLFLSQGGHELSIEEVQAMIKWYLK